MPTAGLLGWLRTGLPGRPRQETRGRGGAKKAAAPPAGAGGPPETGGGCGGGDPAHPGASGSPDGDSNSNSAGSNGSSNTSSKGAPGGGLGLPANLPLGVAAALHGARGWGFLWKGLALHSANLAASLTARPLQDRLQAQLAGTPAVQEACRQLAVDGLADLQDLLNCILLSEHVYKIVDHSTETSVGMMNAVKAGFPPHLSTLRSVQWAQPHVRHRFLVGESQDALYVSFMGTKLPRDMATNANLFMEEVFLDAAMLNSGSSADFEDGGNGGGGGVGAAGGRTLAAHRGFLARSRSIPIQSLYQEARSRGKRLVLCGHSLGGAVATLCSIQLLQHLPPNLHHTVSCYGFATPALGNEALAATVAECGWDARIRNYLAPDDPIPTLLSFNRPPPSSAEKAATAAAAAAANKAPQQLKVSGSSSSANGGSSSAQPLPGVGTSAGLGSANNIQAAPQLAAASAAQQRLQRVASHVAVDGQGAKDSGAERRAGSSSSNSSAAAIPRSSSAPALLLLEDSRGAAIAASSSQLAEVSSADAQAATSPAVTAAILGQEAPVSHLDARSSSGSGKPGRQHWQRLAAAAAPPLRAAAQRAGSAALMAATPPVRAVVERAGSAARLVTLPLSAAASVPMRAAPQYLPLGRQLYILPGAVSPAKPDGSAPAPAVNPVALMAAVAPVVAPVVARHQWAPFWRPQAAAAAVTDSAGSGSSLDDEDNVDVAAASLGLADPSAAAAAAAAVAAGQGDAGAKKQQQQQRRALFEAHKMATYRNRLLAFCQGSLQGHLLLRSLPMLPNLPRPGDVTASELVAPSMFPLRAVATMEPAAAATVVAGSPAGGASAKLAAAAAPAPAATGTGAGGAAQPAGPQQQPGNGEGTPSTSKNAQRRNFWQRLLARAGREQQDPPVELLIRVDGRGLANVTGAWIEGVPPTPAAAPGNKSNGNASSGEGKPGTGSTNGSSSSSNMAQVTILQQPQAPLLLPLRERPMLPVVSQLSAFVSWLAVTLGWVTLLRQLQPPGRSDFLLARVRLPASAVRDAQRAAQGSLLTSMTDGPLLTGLHLGPRLSLRLQSDFASHSVPLDIRAAADLHSQQQQRAPGWQGWQWPWQRREPQALLLQGKQAVVLPRPSQQLPQRQAEAQHGLRWWDWGSPSSAGR